MMVPIWYAIFPLVYLLYKELRGEEWIQAVLTVLLLINAIVIAIVK